MKGAQDSISTCLTKCCGRYDCVNHRQKFGAIIGKYSDFIASVEKSSSDVFAKRPVSFELLFAE